MNATTPLLVMLALSMGLMDGSALQAIQAAEEAEAEHAVEQENNTSAPSVEAALKLFDEGDRAGAVDMLHAIEASGEDSIYSDGLATVTKACAFPNTDDTYTVFLFGKIDAPDGEISKMSILDNVYLVMNNLNEYRDCIELNLRHSIVETLAAKGYYPLGQTKYGTYKLESGDDPCWFVTWFGSVSSNDCNYENGVVSIRFDSIDVDKKNVGRDINIVFPTADIEWLSSYEDFLAMIDSL